MNTMRQTLLTIFGLLATTWSFGQTFTISGGDISTCSGELWDSGGDASTGYLDNEDYTMTVCPDGSGESAISLEWLVFQLSLEGDFGTLDRLSIYDGDDTTAPLIGVWTGSAAPSIVAASFTNATGCLTLRFESNDVGIGAFVASISCYTPCEPPVAVSSMGTPPPALLCVGEPITFDGSASTAAAGFNVASYAWDFRDGSPIGSDVLISHSFSAPGEYYVSLSVTDDNDCVSTNVEELQVRVSTVADFTGTMISDNEVCTGETVTLTGVVESPTWTNTPLPFVEGLTFLPDGTGVTYTSEMTVAGLPNGTQIGNAEDVVEVCLVLEHSFVGDLIVNLTNPDGDQVLLFDGNPGGGTYLGEANNQDDGVPGVGWLYCFQNVGLLGTLPDEILAGNTIEAGDPPNAAAVPGVYTSQESFGGWIGGAVNGIWTLSILDDQGIDDGYIFEWYMTFNPLLYPDAITFTPHIGMGPDSTAWSGPNIVGTDPNGEVATVIPSEIGQYEYTYTATNDFGCSFDTTFTINVVPGIEGPIIITGDDLVCDGSIGTISAPAGFDSYTWSNSSVGQVINVGPGTYTVTVSEGACNMTSEPFVMEGAPSPSPVIQGPEFSCGGQPAVLTTTETYASYSWSNGSPDPSITVGSGSYSVTVTNTEGCSTTSDPFVVTVGSAPQANYTVAPPSPQGIGTTAIFTDASTGNGSPLTDWAWEFGIPGQGSTTPSTSYTFDTPGTYNVTLTVTAADGCEDALTLPYVILAEEVIIPNVFTPNGDANNEYFVIENGQYYTNTLAIYNRWGQAVFDVKNYRNNWRAADVPDGTYYYVFTIDNGKEYTGHVSILR